MTKARDLANAGTALTTVSATELGYLDGVTSAVQTQLNAKQAVVSGVDSTEIGYLDGVTSAIQTQLNAKAASSTAVTLTGAQTLTNKTITAPHIIDGLFQGSEEVIAGIGGTFTSSGFTYNVSSGTVQWLSSNATGNGAVNIQYTPGTTLNSSMANNTAITVVLGIANGTTPYYVNALTIDGSAPALLKWAGGTAPTSGNASSQDWYQFTVIKVSSANFYVFASQSKY
jgi:hypothetical protein